MKQAKGWIVLGAAAMLIGCAAAVLEPVAPGQQSQAAAPAQYLEIAIGENGKYVWNDRQWEVDDLKSALKRERRARSFNEIRLVDNGVSMTIANMIEVGALGKAIGVRAYYETGDEFKEIIFVD